LLAAAIGLACWLLVHGGAPLPLYAQSTPQPTATPDAEAVEAPGSDELNGDALNDTLDDETLNSEDESIAEHVVVAGESLSVIAVRYGVSMTALMQENGITDPDAIRIGQRLRLPPNTGRPVVGVDPQFVWEDDPAIHVVLPGETVLGIALRYGIAPDELMALNGITNPDHIVIGRQLRLTPALETEPARAAEDIDEDVDGDPNEAIAEEPPDTPDDLDEATEVDVEAESDEIERDEVEADPAIPEDVELDAIALEESAGPLDPLWAISSLNRRVRVGPGDSVSRLALRYGVNEDALRRINRLTTSQALVLDQELILPATRQELESPTPVIPEDDRIYHEVRPGESLGLIAQAHGLTLADLLSANRITDPNNILIGQRLLIPEPAGDENAASESGPVQIGRPQRGYFFYTVRPGDTLSELAREFNTTFLAILDYNNLPDPETVYRGVDLRIPFGPPTPPVQGPPSPQSGTRFMISLSRQQCWVLQGDRVIHEWICSTGYGEWITRTGVFAVQTKLEMAQSNFYELDMPYWLGIYDVGSAENGIHGLPIEWATGEKIWEGLLGQPATFGCAMLTDEDAATLFELAYLGMPVYIVN
jgi:LysM repeat protein